jgi:hypothetical protein
VVCAPDDGWWCHSKHVEQFPDKINCVTLHLVGYIRIHLLWYNFNWIFFNQVLFNSVRVICVLNIHCFSRSLLIYNICCFWTNSYISWSWNIVLHVVQLQAYRQVQTFFGPRTEWLWVIIVSLNSKSNYVKSFLNSTCIISSCSVTLRSVHYVYWVELIRLWLLVMNIWWEVVLWALHPNTVRVIRGQYGHVALRFGELQYPSSTPPPCELPTVCLHYVPQRSLWLLTGL